jgi:hypothetical protein
VAAGEPLCNSEAETENLPLSPHVASRHPRSMKMDIGGKLIMESALETKVSTILQFIQGLRGDLYVTFEKVPGRPGCLMRYEDRTSRSRGASSRTPRIESGIGARQRA